VNRAWGRALLVLLTAVAGCGDSTVCGDGTHLDGTMCVASLPTQCGPGTQPQGGQCIPTDGGGAACGPGTHLEGGTCTADVVLSGNAARFRDVELTAPAEFVNIANAQLHEAFLTGETLVFVGAYRPRQDQLSVFGGGGQLHAGGWYDLDRTSSFDASVTTSAGTFTSQPFTFVMHAFGAVQSIELVDTVISEGTLVSPDGVELVQSGVLSGVLTPTAADRVYIESANQSLYDLMTALQITPDVDQDGNGSKESWTMALRFATEPVWLF
jgi:hypothetical protein